MDLPAPSAPARVSRRSGRRRFWLVVGVLLALLVLFEVGIRQAPPDGMLVTYEYGVGSADIGTRAYTLPKDQQTIRDYYAAFNAASVRPVFGQYGGCVLTADPSSVVFTWHGVPVESWTLVGCVYDESVGGIPDEATLTEHNLPLIDAPPPPPK